MYIFLFFYTILSCEFIKNNQVTFEIALQNLGIQKDEIVSEEILIVDAIKIIEKNLKKKTRKMPSRCL